jgi:Predicted membrane protein (DUF2207)
MDSHRSSRFVQAILYALLLSSAIANAQTGDRISRFDSKITVAKDRTLYVDEKVEITNDNGFLDRGFHRRLPVKASGPQRTKAGSFQDIRATVDGSEALVRTTHNDEFWDVEISIAPASWSPSKHVIELSYTAKHQFLVYDDFEDLNQNISGKWPIPIDRASVELNFPSGIPGGASISADTASSTGSLFDCVRTNLAVGVRFETSHPLEPNNRLFISARFYPRGYFVSNFDEDGVRAVLENHPRLYPWIAFFFGLIIFTSSAFLVTTFILKAIGGARAIGSDHRIATIVASVATLLSGATAVLFHQPYAAMPGFWLGAIFSIMLSGNPHGGEPFSLVTVALASNFAFYYLIARGLRSACTHRQDHL